MRFRYIHALIRVADLDIPVAPRYAHFISPEIPRPVRGNAGVACGAGKATIRDARRANPRFDSAAGHCHQKHQGGTEEGTAGAIEPGPHAVACAPGSWTSRRRVESALPLAFGKSPAIAIPSCSSRNISSENIAPNPRGRSPELPPVLAGSMLRRSPGTMGDFYESVAALFEAWTGKGHEAFRGPRATPPKMVHGSGRA